MQLFQLFLRLLQIFQRRLCTAAVLLLQTVNNIKALLYLRCTLTVKLTACHIFAQLRAAIVQADPGTVSTLCQRRQTAVVACRILQLVAHSRQTRKNRVLLIKLLIRAVNSLHNALTVLQQACLRLQAIFLARLQGSVRNLLDFPGVTIQQQILLLIFLLQTAQMLYRSSILAVKLLILLQCLRQLRTAKSICQMQRRIRLQQGLVLVLAVNIHQTRTDSLQHSQRHLHAVDISAALARSTYLTLQK